MKNDFILALHCLLLLAFHKKERFSSTTLAQKTCSNPATIRRIMSLLQKNQYIVTTFGANGGYQLLQPAETIRLGSLFLVVNGPVTTTSFVSDQIDLTCLVAQHLDGFITTFHTELFDQTIQYLNTKTLADYLKTIETAPLL